MSSSSEDTKVRSPDDVATRTATIAAVKSPAKWFVLGGIIAGALDLAYALTFSALRGVPPMRILQAIASGLLGKPSFTGGATTAALGLLLHFLIAIAAAGVFYAASRRFDWLVRRAVVAGIVFGLCVYAVMNAIVLPLSAIPFKLTYAPLALVTDLLSHMFLFGVPIALCVRAGYAGGWSRRG